MCRACLHLVQAVTLHTSKGDLKLELLCEEVPKACQNFLALCASKYFDGSIFHRNIPGAVQLCTCIMSLCCRGCLGSAHRPEGRRGARFLCRPHAHSSKPALQAS